MTDMANLSYADDDDWTHIEFGYRTVDPPLRIALLEKREWRVEYRRNGWWRRWRFDRRRLKAHRQNCPTYAWSEAYEGIQTCDGKCPGPIDLDPEGV